MSIGDQDHGGVAMAVAVAGGHLDQAIHLAVGEVFTRATVGKFFKGVAWVLGEGSCALMFNAERLELPAQVRRGAGEDVQAIGLPFVRARIRWQRRVTPRTAACRSMRCCHHVTATKSRQQHDQALLPQPHHAALVRHRWRVSWRRLASGGAQEKLLGGTGERGLLFRVFHEFRVPPLLLTLTLKSLFPMSLYKNRWNNLVQEVQH
jgi:hypothetical protein